MIQFTGKIRSGKGEHSDLVIPGSSELGKIISDWPKCFYPGSLNVGINGYPEGFSASPDGVTRLDSGAIQPTVVLDWNQIKNNKLRPKQDNPQRGTGQFWPAVLTVDKTGESIDCWVFRRINSTIKKQLELISQKRIRESLSLDDGTEVSIKLYSKEENRTS